MMTGSSSLPPPPARAAAAAGLGLAASGGPGGRDYFVARGSTRRWRRCRSAGKGVALPTQNTDETCTAAAPTSAHVSPGHQNMATLKQRGPIIGPAGALVLGVVTATNLPNNRRMHGAQLFWLSTARTQIHLQHGHGHESFATFEKICALVVDWSQIVRCRAFVLLGCLPQRLTGNMSRVVNKHEARHGAKKRRCETLTCVTNHELALGESGLNTKFASGSCPRFENAPITCAAGALMAVIDDEAIEVRRAAASAIVELLWGDEVDTLPCGRIGHGNTASDSSRGDSLRTMALLVDMVADEEAELRAYNLDQLATLGRRLVLSPKQVDSVGKCTGEPDACVPRSALRLLAAASLRSRPAFDAARTVLVECAHTHPFELSTITQAAGALRALHSHTVLCSRSPTVLVLFVTPYEAASCGGEHLLSSAPEQQIFLQLAESTVDHRLVEESTAISPLARESDFFQSEAFNGTHERLQNLGVDPSCSATGAGAGERHGSERGSAIAAAAAVARLGEASLAKCTDVLATRRMSEARTLAESAAIAVGTACHCSEADPRAWLLGNIRLAEHVCEAVCLVASLSRLTCKTSPRVGYFSGTKLELCALHAPSRALLRTSYELELGYSSLPNTSLRLLSGARVWAHAALQLAAGAPLLATGRDGLAFLARRVVSARGACAVLEPTSTLSSVPWHAHVTSPACPMLAMLEQLEAVLSSLRPAPGATGMAQTECASACLVWSTLSTWLDAHAANLVHGSVELAADPTAHGLPRRWSSALCRATDIGSPLLRAALVSLPSSAIVHRAEVTGELRAYEPLAEACVLQTTSPFQLTATSLAPKTRNSFFVFRSLLMQSCSPVTATVALHVRTYRRVALDVPELDIEWCVSANAPPSGWYTRLEVEAGNLTRHSYGPTVNIGLRLSVCVSLPSPSETCLRSNAVMNSPTG